MMVAALNGHEAVVVALHGFGADVNAVDNVSRTLLDRGRESCFCVCMFVRVHVLNTNYTCENRG